MDALWRVVAKVFNSDYLLLLLATAIIFLSRCRVDQEQPLDREPPCATYGIASQSGRGEPS